MQNVSNVHIKANGLDPESISQYGDVTIEKKEDIEEVIALHTDIINKKDE